MEQNLYKQMHQDGFAVIKNVLSTTEIRCVAELFATSVADRAGRRLVLRDFPALARLAMSAQLRRLVEPILGPQAVAVRAMLFEKNAGTNWRIRWHQDKTIAVQERAVIDGFTGWSNKSGIPHVQAPSYVMARMVALRLQIDAAAAESGGLRVCPGTHAGGILSVAEISQATQQNGARQTVAHPGDVLFLVRSRSGRGNASTLIMDTAKH